MWNGVLISPLAKKTRSRSVSNFLKNETNCRQLRCICFRSVDSSLFTNAPVIIVFLRLLGLTLYYWPAGNWESNLQPGVRQNKKIDIANFVNLVRLPRLKTFIERFSFSAGIPCIFCRTSKYELIILRANCSKFIVLWSIPRRMNLDTDQVTQSWQLFALSSLHQ